MLHIAGLARRYGISRQSISTRIDKLGIAKAIIGGKSYVDDKDVKELDKPNEFINAGGNIADYVRGIAPDSLSPKPNQPTTRSPLDYLRELEECVANRWILKSSEIAKLLGISEDLLVGKYFSDAGFLFTRDGHRADGQPAWRVEKQEPHRFTPRSDAGAES